MSDKEATARIKINKLLEAAGWRFFRGRQRARQHPSRTQRHDQVDRPRRARRQLREDGEGLHRLPSARRQGLPVHRPGSQGRGQEPARRQGAGPQVRPSQNCRFVILSNGNLHYFWDLERGNPYVITSFPTPDSVIGYQKVTPNPQRLIAEQVGDDYIVLTQRPNYQSEAGVAERS